MEDKKVALVTGASRGIGQSIAIKFAKEGLQVAITGRKKDDLEQTARLITEAGGEKPLTVVADLKDLNQIPGLANKVINEYGRIDLLINNAGLGYLKPFLEISMVEFEEMMDVNMRAVFYLTQQVLPHMIEQKDGMILNIASLAGKNGFKTGTGYGASKWALRGFSQSLMLEVREHDIRVVTIFPGSVDTDFSGGGNSPTGTPKPNKISPDDIAETAWLAFSTPRRTMISEIDMRPTNPKKSS